MKYAGLYLIAAICLLIVVVAYVSRFSESHYEDVLAEEGIVDAKVTIIGQSNTQTVFATFVTPTDSGTISQGLFKQLEIKRYERKSPL